MTSISPISTGGAGDGGSSCGAGGSAGPGELAVWLAAGRAVANVTAQKKISAMTHHNAARTLAIFAHPPKDSAFLPEVGVIGEEAITGRLPPADLRAG